MKNLTVIVCLLLGTVSLVNAGPIIKDTLLRFGDNDSASLTLERLQDLPEESRILELQVSISNAKNLKGYGFVLCYDATKYEFIEAVSNSDSFINKDNKEHPLFIFHDKSGRVNISSLKVGKEGSSGDGKLVKFRFETSREIWRNPSVSDFRILDGMVIDLSGGTNPVDNTIGNLRDIPKKYVLEQNIPNPFNPSTSISYHLPENTHVKIVVYNMLGQEVRELFKGDQVSGFHTVVWNGKDNLGRQVASGIYAYRLIAGDFISSRRMILLK